MMRLLSLGAIDLGHVGTDAIFLDKLYSHLSSKAHSGQAVIDVRHDDRCLLWDFSKHADPESKHEGRLGAQIVEIVGQVNQLALFDVESAVVH